jgi:hypothetical protein
MQLAERSVRIAGMALGLVLAACTAIPSPTPTASSRATESPAPTVSESAVSTGPVQLATEGIECANDRFAIHVPAGWWYAASGPSACLYFNREPFEIAGFEPTDRVAIEIRWLEGDVGTFDEIVMREDLMIDGEPAVRWELVTGGQPGGVLPPDLHIYQYIVQLGPLPETGPNLLAQTMSWFEEYLENQQVLDAIMGTLRLAG